MSEVMFPAGRMIGGSLYKAYPETDNFGKPKIDAAGKEVTSFSFGMAIPKGAEQHWSQTPWGAEVVKVGQTAHPKNFQSPAYAWKIKDGDSTVPNKNGKLVRDTEGCSGAWVIWFKQKWAPKLVAEKGSIQLIEPEAIIPGYYIEVYANVIGNTGPSPGVYLNPIAVNRVAFGEKLVQANVDTSSVGFGQSAVPAGASLTPVGGGFVIPAQTPDLGINPSFQPLGGNPAPAPNTAFLAIPPVPSAPKFVMTALANGMAREQFLATPGWTDALLVEHGYMLP